MGKNTLLLSLVCSLFIFDVVQCWSLVKKEASCKIHTTSGECCVFPFKYNGKTYKSCTVDNHDKMWCSRTPDYDSDSKWGNCKFEDCQIKTTDGVCCVFPFYYNYRKYYGCTSKYHDGKAWCGTQKYVVWWYGGWGDCAKPCDSSPCKNNGICENIENSFRCTCTQGFEGKTCEKKVNPCDSSPCKNGGICESVVDSFNCSCAKGFQGKTCEEIGYSECSGYKWLTEANRNVKFTSSTDLNKLHCDFWPSTGWYRFGGGAGTQMPTSCVPIYKCGTISTGWMNGAHPSVDEGKVTRKVCFRWGSDCCHFSNKIEVVNCGIFYVYKLSRAPTCMLGYCGRDV